MVKQKPRVIKSYEKIDEKLREAIAERYPLGYTSEIQMYDVGGGKFMAALPFETDDYYYLIKFPISEDHMEDLEDSVGGADDLDLEGGEDVEEEEEATG